MNLNRGNFMRFVFCCVFTVCCVFYSEKKRTKNEVVCSTSFLARFVTLDSIKAFTGLGTWSLIGFVNVKLITCDRPNYLAFSKT